MMIEKHDDATCRVMGQPCASKRPNASVYLSKSCGSFRACDTLYANVRVKLTAGQQPSGQQRPCPSARSQQQFPTDLPSLVLPLIEQAEPKCPLKWAETIGPKLLPMGCLVLSHVPWLEGAPANFSSPHFRRSLPPSSDPPSTLLQLLLSVCGVDFFSVAVQRCHPCPESACKDRHNGPH